MIVQCFYSQVTGVTSVSLQLIPNWSGSPVLASCLSDSEKYEKTKPVASRSSSSGLG